AEVDPDSAFTFTVAKGTGEVKRLVIALDGTGDVAGVRIHHPKEGVGPSHERLQLCFGGEFDRLGRRVDSVERLTNQVEEVRNVDKSIDSQIIVAVSRQRF